MSIVDRQSVDIEIFTLADKQTSGLSLNYQSQRYDLVQAFASHKLKVAQQRFQQLNDVTPDRYLIVDEIGYYSLWLLESSQQIAIKPQSDLTLQQASIWLFQELWLQWQDLLGANQIDVLAENLLAVNNPLQSRADIDRLLDLNHLTTAKLEDWTEVDLIGFDRQIYHLTQQKVGQQFGTRVTIDIVESMPVPLRSILADILALDRIS